MKPLDPIVRIAPLTAAARDALVALSRSLVPSSANPGTKELVDAGLLMPLADSDRWALTALGAIVLCDILTKSADYDSDRAQLLVTLSRILLKRAP